MPKRMRDLPVEYEIHRRSLAQAMGERLRVRRAELQLTQEHLRARLELEQVAISRTQYSRIENGEILPDAAELRALRTILDVSYDWLVEGLGGRG
jgi:transcriptional regulator with XRE-family HTH domain